MRITTTYHHRIVYNIHIKSINHTHALPFINTFTYNLAIHFFISNFTLPILVWGLDVLLTLEENIPLSSLVTGYKGVYKTITTSLVVYS